MTKPLVRPSLSEYDHRGKFDGAGPAFNDEARWLATINARDAEIERLRALLATLDRRERHALRGSFAATYEAVVPHDGTTNQ